MKKKEKYMIIKEDIWYDIKLSGGKGFYREKGKKRWKNIPPKSTIDLTFKIPNPSHCG